MEKPLLASCSILFADVLQSAMPHSRCTYYRRVPTRSAHLWSHGPALCNVESERSMGTRGTRHGCKIRYTLVCFKEQRLLGKTLEKGKLKKFICHKNENTTLTCLVSTKIIRLYYIITKICRGNLFHCVHIHLLVFFAL